LKRACTAGVGMTGEIARVLQKIKKKKVVDAITHPSRKNDEFSSRRGCEETLGSEKKKTNAPKRVKLQQRESAPFQPQKGFTIQTGQYLI